MIKLLAALLLIQQTAWAFRIEYDSIHNQKETQAGAEFNVPSGTIGALFSTGTTTLGDAAGDNLTLNSSSITLPNAATIYVNSPASRGVVFSSRTICSSFWFDANGNYQNIASSVTTNGVGADATTFRTVNNATLNTLSPKAALIAARGYGTTETATANIQVCLRSVGDSSSCDETTAIMHETTRADTEDMSTYGTGWVALNASFDFDFSLRAGGFASGNVTADLYLQGVCW